MTLKKALLRGLLGVPIGVTIAQLITISISIIQGGDYVACVPTLAVAMGGNTNGVALQFLLSAALGFSFAASSAIFEVDQWSIAKQTVLHFAAMTLTYMPIAAAARWVEFTPRALCSYFGIFVALYVGIWLIQYGYWRRRVKGINKKLAGER